MTVRKRLVSACLHAILLVGVAFSVLPFFWMISTSLKTNEEVNQSEIRWWPHKPQWANYPEAVRRASSIKSSFARSFANSAAVAVAVTAGVLVTAVLAAYGFSFYRFRGQGLLFLLFLTPMMIPFEVILVPNFAIINELGWYDTYRALIIPWIANVFSIFFLRRIFDRIPREVYDAARVDGCGGLRFLWSVAIPMVKPALITIGLYTFLGSWNAFLWPLVATSSPELAVVQKALATFVQEAGTEYHLLMAAATLTVLPVVIIYLVSQRWFHEGAEQIKW